MLTPILKLGLLLWLGSILAFATIRAMPADPAVLLLTEAHQVATPAAVAALHRAWGLDRPLPVQYVAWLGRFLTGDWGSSFRTGIPILEEFARRLPVSLAIGMGGLLLGLTLGALLGFEAAMRPDGKADRISRGLAVATQAVPTFISGLAVIWLLAVQLGVIRPLSGGPVETVLLPILVVGLHAAGSLTRVFRAELLRTAQQPFFRTALAKGLSRRAALRRHAAGHAALGLLGALTPECAWAIGGTAVTEVVFGVPGISDFVVQSIGYRDYFVLQAYVMAMAAWMGLVATAAALLRRCCDPRHA